MSESRTPIRHVVVAHDFSESAQRALAFALELARSLGARVTIVHASDVVTYGYAESVVLTAEVMSTVRRLAQAALEKLAQESESPNLEVAWELRAGGAQEQIVAFARESKADLLVVGTHGRRGLPRLLLGSVAERVVRTAPCPVVVVPGPEGHS